MKRRTRITLAAAALTLAALGGTYGLVSQQVVPSAGSSTAVAATTQSQSAAPSTRNIFGFGATTAPPVTHSHTRAS